MDEKLSRVLGGFWILTESLLEDFTLSSRSTFPVLDDIWRVREKSRMNVIWLRMEGRMEIIGGIVRVH
jgi:hypothetical protein